MGSPVWKSKVGKFLEQIGLKDCKWPSLNAPGTVSLRLREPSIAPIGRNLSSGTKFTNFHIEISRSCVGIYSEFKRAILPKRLETIRQGTGVAVGGHGLFSRRNECVSSSGDRRAYFYPRCWLTGQSAPSFACLPSRSLFSGVTFLSLIKDEG